MKKRFTDFGLEVIVTVALQKLQILEIFKRYGCFIIIIFFLIWCKTIAGLILKYSQLTETWSVGQISNCSTGLDPILVHTKQKWAWTSARLYTIVVMRTCSWGTIP